MPLFLFITFSIMISPLLASDGTSEQKLEVHVDNVHVNCNLP